MKFLIFLLAILFGVWLWRRNRLNDFKQRDQNRAPRQPTEGQTSTPQHPSPMLACLHCGVHMPEADMFKGTRGIYCTPAHCHAAADQASSEPS